jgi:hypothetical protein
LESLNKSGSQKDVCLFPVPSSKKPFFLAFSKREVERRYEKHLHVFFSIALLRGKTEKTARNPDRKSGGFLFYFNQYNSHPRSEVSPTGFLKVITTLSRVPNPLPGTAREPHDTLQCHSEWRLSFPASPPPELSPVTDL